MQALLLSSLVPASGNNSTTSRLLAYFGGCTGCEKATAIDVGKCTREELAELYQGHDVAFGVHAFRAGKWLVDCPIPFVIVLGGTDMNCDVHDAAKMAVMTAALRQAVCVVAFHQALRDAVVRHFPFLNTDFIKIISPAVIPARPSPPFSFLAALNLPPSTHLFVLPCGIRPVKDPEYLVSAVAQWHERDASVVLVIVGAAHPDASAFGQKFLASIAARSEDVVDDVLSEAGGFGGRGVYYHPAVPRGALFEAIKQEATATVNSSLSEGASNAILEAMTEGIPVIARRISGNECLITHEETGLLYGTPEEFVSLAAAVIEGKHDSIGAMAARHVLDNNSPEREAQAYLDIAEQMAGTASSRRDGSAGSPGVPECRTRLPSPSPSPNVEARA